MPKVLMTKRDGLHWPGADRDVSPEEAKALIASGAAVELNDENRKKVRESTEASRLQGAEAEAVEFPVEHEPKFRDVKAYVNPPVDNAGAEPVQAAAAKTTDVKPAARSAPADKK